MSRSDVTFLGPVENSGPNTVASYLKNVGSRCSEADIAVAFVTVAGVDALRYVLHRIARRGNVRLLTGVYQGFTEPAALQSLLRLQHETKGRFKVRISANGRFHWKAYLMKRRRTTTVLIGSSNLTEDGLRQPGELNVALSLSTTSAAYRQLQQVFHRNWERAVEFTAGQIAKYERVRDIKGLARRIKPISVRKIFEISSGRKRSGLVQANQRYWRSGVTGSVSDETESLLSETTDWDRRGLEYVTATRNGFMVGDRIVLATIVKPSKLEVVEVVDRTELPVASPDGRYFTAYKRLKRIRARRFTSRLRSALKESRLPNRKRDFYRTCRISPKRFEAFVEFLRDL